MIRGTRIALAQLAGLGSLVALYACNGQLRFEDGDAAAAAATRCAVDSDCKLSTLHCDAVSGQCVACTSDAQCARPDGHRCDLASQTCVGCIVTEDCPHDRVCEPTTRRCVLTCPPSPGLCPPGVPWCDAARNICVRCRSDADCVGSDDGPTCDAADGRCAFCVDDTQCSVDAPRCERTHGRCVRCTGAADCPASMVCDPQAFTCV
jgi:hypothetical protein